MNLPERQVRVVVLETEHEPTVISTTVRVGSFGSASDDSSIAGIMSRGTKFMLQVITGRSIGQTIIQPARRRENVDLEV